MSSYQVLFSGDISDDADTAAVQDNIARELGIDARKAKALFSGRTVVLRSQLSQADAEAMQQRLENLGALARIKSLQPAAAPAPADGSRRAAANDYTLRDITAAHLECPRCSHMQLESTFCARCGVDLQYALKQKRKEDLIIQKKIDALRNQRPAAGSAPAANDPWHEAHQPPALDTEPSRSPLGKVVSWMRR